MIPFFTAHFSPASDKNFGEQISAVNCMTMVVALVNYGLNMAAVVDYALMLSGVRLKFL